MLTASSRQSFAPLCAFAACNQLLWAAALAYGRQRGSLLWKELSLYLIVHGLVVGAAYLLAWRKQLLSGPVMAWDLGSKLLWLSLPYWYSKGPIWAKLAPPFMRINALAWLPVLLVSLWVGWPQFRQDFLAPAEGLRLEPNTGLYPQLVGEEGWQGLPEPLRRWYEEGSGARGTFQVDLGRSLLARLMVFNGAAPPKAGELPMKLVIRRSGDFEYWQRHFGDHPMDTVQRAHPSGSMVEQAGILDVVLRLWVEEERLHFESRGTYLRLGPLRIPIPSFLAGTLKAESWFDKDAERLGAKIVVRGPKDELLLSYAGLMTPTYEDKPTEKQPGEAA